MWLTQWALDRLRDVDTVTYIMVSCAVWAYGHVMLTEVGRKTVEATALADKVCAQDPATLFAWHTFVSTYGHYRAA